MLNHIHNNHLHNTGNGGQTMGEKMMYRQKMRHTHLGERSK